MRGKRETERRHRKGERERNTKGVEWGGDGEGLRGRGWERTKR